MSTIALKIQANAKMDASWIVTGKTAAELLITEIPDGTPIAEVVRLANATALNVPAKPKTTPTVAFDRLVPGRFVNLYAKPGPEPMPEDERPVVGSLRLPPAYWADVREFGTTWLMAAVDKERALRGK